MNLFKNVLFLVTLLFLCACGDTRHQFRASSYNSSPVTQASFMIEKDKTLPPYGYVDFCIREPKECPEWKNRLQNQADISPTASIETNSINGSTNNPQSRDISVQNPSLSYQEVMDKLQEVNDIVNIAVRPVSDPDGFGVTEEWRIPDISGYFGDIGDCEDYALLKRKMLAQAGFDYNKLSMAVVKQSNGTAHAILVARTSYGDFVLDNLETDIKPWQEVSYKWIKKQSIINPSVWVSI